MSTDCEGAHGNNRDGRCPRCTSPVRVVGYESCDCGREHVEQLVPGWETSPRLREMAARYKSARECALSMAECLADGRPVDHAIARAVAFLERARGE